MWQCKDMYYLVARCGSKLLLASSCGREFYIFRLNVCQLVSAVAHYKTDKPNRLKQCLLRHLLFILFNLSIYH